MSHRNKFFQMISLILLEESRKLAFRSSSKKNKPLFSNKAVTCDCHLEESIDRFLNQFLNDFEPLGDQQTKNLSCI